MINHLIDELITVFLTIDCKFVILFMSKDMLFKHANVYCITWKVTGNDHQMGVVSCIDLIIDYIDYV